MKGWSTVNPYDRRAWLHFLEVRADDRESDPTTQFCRLALRDPSLPPSHKSVVAYCRRRGAPKETLAAAKETVAEFRRFRAARLQRGVW